MPEQRERHSEYWPQVLDVPWGHTRGKNSKSADPCGHGGSTPPPGTIGKPIYIQRFAKRRNRSCLFCAQNVFKLSLTGITKEETSVVFANCLDLNSD